MIWEVDWGKVIVDDVRRMHWTTAARICSAVIEFGRTGKGPVRRVQPQDPRRLELSVSGATAYLFLDFDLGVVRVQRIFSR